MAINKRLGYSEVEYPHRQVQLLNNPWTIYVVPKKHPRLLGAWGTTHFNQKEIYITNHLSEKNFRWTLTHEMLHAFLDELGCHSMLLEKIHKKKMKKWLTAWQKRCILWLNVLFLKFQTIK